jgi:selenocysteine lyase/cysteine desulfurase
MVQVSESDSETGTPARRPIDPVEEQARTPGSSSRHHLNAAGAALQTTDTVEAVVRHLRLEEAVGGYEAATRKAESAAAVYDTAAIIVGAQPEEIALFDSATTAMRQVIETLRLRRGRRIVASRSTYVSQALHLMTIAREQQLELVIVPNDESGTIDLTELDAALDGTTESVVFAAHLSTSCGAVEPVVEIGRIAAAHGALFVLDATQSVGQIPVDVREVGCDVLVTTGRKFLRAPRGTAFAYVSESLSARLVPNAPDVRGSSWTSEQDWSVVPSARMLETWEHSIAGRLGLAAALEQAVVRGIPETHSYVSQLAETARERLGSIRGVRLADPPGSRSGIVTFQIEGTIEQVACEEMRKSGVYAIAVPAGHAQWDLGARGITSVIRASVHVYNDLADIDALTDEVEKLAHRSRTVASL